MRFVETEIPGAFVIELEIHEDERGYLARSFCETELAQAGIEMHVVQANVSHNPRALTLRGMHYQAHPHGEPKIVHCVRGRIHDVAIDLRPHSPTFRRSVGIELSPEARRLFYMPIGCAHGFLTLENNTDVLYLMGAPFIPEAARGVRWNDPAFRIAWPEEPVIISERDATFANYFDELSGNGGPRHDGRSP